MKLNAFQLEQHLKQKTLSAVFMICGEEPFMVQETVDLIRQKAFDLGFTEWLRLSIENDTDWEACYHHAYTSPLLGQKRLLELHLKTKPTKTGQQFLVNYAKRPSPHHVLLICMGRLDNKTEKTPWVKALEQTSIIVPLWPLSPKQLPAWLMQRAKKQQLTLSPDAATRLADAVEGNMAAAAQEIEKLSLLGTATIDRSLIEEIVMDQGCFNAFDLVDHALSGHSAKSLRILAFLHHEGTEPLMIIGAFTHELRTLATLANQVGKGASLAALFAQYRVRLSRQDPVREFLKRHTEKTCQRLILKAAEIDRIIKGALAGNIWEALEDFCLAVTR